MVSKQTVPTKSDFVLALGIDFSAWSKLQQSLNIKIFKLNPKNLQVKTLFTETIPPLGQGDEAAAMRKASLHL